MAANAPAPLLRWYVGGGVNSVAVSHDGSRVASGSTDCLVRIWDVRTGVPVLGPLLGHTAGVNSVAWSRNSSLIVSGSMDSTIRIWDTMTGAPVGDPLVGHTAAVFSVAFSPDSTRIVSGSRDETIHIWDVRTGAPTGEPLRGYSGWVWSVAFSPDSTRIASGAWDTICLWNARTGAPIGEPLEGHGNTVYSVAFSPDSTLIVSGSYDKTIRIWNARTGAPISDPLREHCDWIRSVAFSSDGNHLVSGAEDRTVRIWDARTGAPIGGPLRGHTSYVWSVAFVPDSSRIVSGSADGTICVWEAPQGTPSFDMITSKMSVQEMFECLVQHGCTDLTSAVNTDQITSVVVASGGFGDVRRTTMGGTVVAIKTLRLHVLMKDDDKGVKRAVREVYIWSRLRHSNVQKLLGIVVFQGGLGMVSPWMETGNLQQYIAARPDVKRYPLCIQVASGVSYLHRIGMVHGDLKANNVLVSDDGTLKINDFDHAILPETSLRFSTTSRNGGGTLRWMAPELLQEQDNDGSRAQAPAMRNLQTDIYALGMTMLEILTGNVPYAEFRSDMGIYRAIHKKKSPRRPAELSGPEERSGIMWQLLLECWDHDPTVRPDAPTVLELLEFKQSAANIRTFIRSARHRQIDLATSSTSIFSRLKDIYQKITR